MNEFEIKFNQADQLIQENKYLHAIQVLQSLLVVPEYSRKAVIKLVEIYDLQGQIDSASKILINYLSQNDDDENIRAYFAHFLIRNEKFNEAHDILSGLSNKHHPEKSFLMGLVNFYLNDFEVALINFTEFINNNKNSEILPDAYLYKAKCNIEKSELDEAIQNLNSSIKFDNGNSETYTTFAKVYYLKEMYYHALEKIKISIELNPLDLDAIEWSGRIFFKLGDFKNAKKQFELVIEIDKSNSEIFAILGLTCLNLEDFDSAKYYFDEALKLDSTNELAQKGIPACNKNYFDGI